MRAPRKIVVATDFSACAERALSVALAIGAHGKAEIHLVHALEVPAVAYTPYATALPDDLLAAARESAQRRLAGAEATVRERGLPVSSSLASVPAGSAIASTAKQIGADLVVVGSRGHTGLKRLALGSVAEHTVKESPVSVLTVRGEGHAETPRVIVVGVDFSEGSERAVAVAADWARSFGAQLQLVNGLALTMPFLAPYEVTVPDALIDESYAKANKRLAAIAETLRDLDVHASVVSAAPHDALDTVAARVKADLIVTGSRGLRGLKHALLGSVAERTLRHAPCSVLTVKSAVA
jgi:nucleotide-binding universal stress UspA family protein